MHLDSNYPAGIRWIPSHGIPLVLALLGATSWLYQMPHPPHGSLKCPIRLTALSCDQANGFEFTLEGEKKKPGFVGIDPGMGEFIFIFTGGRCLIEQACSPSSHCPLRIVKASAHL